MSNNNMIIYDTSPSIQFESDKEKNVDVNENKTRSLPSVLLLKNSFKSGLMTKNILDVLLTHKNENKTEKSISWKSIEDAITTIIRGSDEQNEVDKWKTMYPICDKEMLIDESKNMVPLVKFCPSMKDVASCCDIFFQS